MINFYEKIIHSLDGRHGSGRDSGAEWFISCRTTHWGLLREAQSGRCPEGTQWSFPCRVQKGRWDLMVPSPYLLLIWTRRSFALGGHLKDSSRSSWWAEGITSMGGEANLSRLRDAEKHENDEMCSWASSLPPSCTSSGCHNTNNPSNFPQALVRWRRTPCGVVVAAFLDHAGESYRVCFASQVWRSSGQPRAQSDQ